MGARGERKKVELWHPSFLGKESLRDEQAARASNVTKQTWKQGLDLRIINQGARSNCCTPETADAREKKSDTRGPVTCGSGYIRMKALKGVKTRR